MLQPGISVFTGLKEEAAHIGREAMTLSCTREGSD